LFGLRCFVSGVWCLMLGVGCLVFGVWCWVCGGTVASIARQVVPRADSHLRPNRAPHHEICPLRTVHLSRHTWPGGLVNSDLHKGLPRNTPLSPLPSPQSGLLTIRALTLVGLWYESVKCPARDGLVGPHQAEDTCSALQGTSVRCFLHHSLYRSLFCTDSAFDRPPHQGLTRHSRECLVPLTNYVCLGRGRVFKKRLSPWRQDAVGRHLQTRTSG